MFLKYSEMWDMPLGGTSADRQIPHWFGNAAWAFIGAIFKVCFRYRVDGREKLRAFDGKSGAVVVCNHTSFLDVVMIYLAARPKQWVRFMGRDTLFDNAGGLLGQALSRVGAFPVKRDSADRTSIKRATRMLKNNELVVIMPEGTRRGKGSATPTIHAGAAFVARMGHAPILPMTVRNAELVKQKGKRLRFPKITVEYGDPILVGDFDFVPKDERLDACSWYAMRECFALSQRVPREEVDMRALFPEGKDYAALFAAHPLPRHSADALAEAAAAKAGKRAALEKGRDAAAAKGVGAGERAGAMADGDVAMAGAAAANAKEA
ncbi:1-acyl-sn-glycerol-3-phosphate acyltransferase [Adlercreutzia sp. ZJ473]|uniref:lysophospholipid acyltransferase family protein n=1 Tax=Adlercreutzia sp. ZJ473 TaxID=2722822 RepID=UPI0020A6AF8B|nr:lysophospholipid acyltransferase family protein [Adlercreutzia sp. ZJ473]